RISVHAPDAPLRQPREYEIGYGVLHDCSRTYVYREQSQQAACLSARLRQGPGGGLSSVSTICPARAYSSRRLYSVLALMPNTAAVCFLTPPQRSSVARISLRSASASVMPSGTVTRAAWLPPSGEICGCRASADNTPSSARIYALRTKFLSSRTLPGHAYSKMAWRACSEN